VRTFLLSLLHVALGVAIGYFVFASRAPSRAEVEQQAIAMLAFPDASAPAGAGSLTARADALLATSDFDAWMYPGARTVSGTFAKKQTYHGSSGEIRSDTGDVSVLETDDPYEAVLAYYHERTGGTGGAEWAKKGWRGGGSTSTSDVNGHPRARIAIGCPRPPDDGTAGDAFDPYARCNVLGARGNGFALTVVIQRCREDKRTYVTLIRDGLSIDRAKKSPE